jgi:cytoskeletal protein CcmA (bactofilin family)
MIMGIFGTQTRQDVELESRTVRDVHETRVEDIPNFPKPQANTVVAKGMTLSGALHGQGTVEVEGVIDGELEVEGSVYVAPSGLVTGPVTADVIRVAGRIAGCVSAREHLRLEKTGSVDGDVSTVSLVVEDGGCLNGRTTTLKPTADGAARRPVQELQYDAEQEELQFGPNFKIGESEDLVAEG